MFLGAFLELLLIIANIGSAVVPFPILKRQSEPAALGYVTARVIESAFIALGIISVLSIVTLRRDPAGANPDSLVAVGQSLVAIHDWTFVLGPGFVVGVGNGLLLGYLMYRSGLVPRRMAMLGLIGGPLVCLSGIAVVFDVIEARLRCAVHLHDPGDRLGAVPWHLPLGQRVQAYISHHRPECGSEESLTQRSELGVSRIPQGDP